MNEIHRRIDQYGTAAIKRIERHNPSHTQQLVHDRHKHPVKNSSE